ncbi:MAG TPA: hypothetical protein PKN28_02215 [Clostridiales bacterium]|nr:hypothetical protein [Clostridiales bacterium]
MAALNLDKKRKTFLTVAILIFTLALVTLILALFIEINEDGLELVTKSNTEKNSPDEKALTEIVIVTAIDKNGKSYTVTQTNKNGEFVPVTAVVRKTGDGNKKENTSGTVPGKTASSKSTSKKALPPPPALGSKTGNNVCTDDPENEYIIAVASHYKVNPDLLVAVYPENFDGKESDNNYVLQFDGTKNTDGAYIRSPRTLKYLYLVKADGEVKKQENKGTYAQFIFSIVTDLIMPQHPDMFDEV